MLTKRLLTAIFFLAVIAAIAIPALMMRDMKIAPNAFSAETLRSAHSGTAVDVVMHVASTGSDGLVEGTLLKADPDGSYSRTADVVLVRMSTSTSFGMGRLADIRPGALVSVKGTWTAARATIEAGRVVILTGYLRLR
ncbi:MAG TPA: hypothetical protein VKT51_05580 [Candidatus Eremiobacteraceae bacterium]|nr:hypothetical protein [Candidatus Eremiobacteraceae bacterium]